MAFAIFPHVCSSLPKWSSVGNITHTSRLAPAWKLALVTSMCMMDECFAARPKRFQGIDRRRSHEQLWRNVGLDFLRNQPRPVRPCPLDAGPSDRVLPLHAPSRASRSGTLRYTCNCLKDIQFPRRRHLPRAEWFSCEVVPVEGLSWFGNREPNHAPNSHRGARVSCPFGEWPPEVCRIISCLRPQPKYPVSSGDYHFLVARAHHYHAFLSPIMLQSSSSPALCLSFPRGAVLLLQSPHWLSNTRLQLHSLAPIAIIVVIIILLLLRTIIIIIIICSVVLHHKTILIRNVSSPCRAM